jgi:hypothetical protein
MDFNNIELGMIIDLKNKLVYYSIHFSCRVGPILGGYVRK